MRPDADLPDEVLARRVEQRPRVLLELVGEALDEVGSLNIAAQTYAILRSPKILRVWFPRIPSQVERSKATVRCSLPDCVNSDDRLQANRQQKRKIPMTSETLLSEDPKLEFVPSMTAHLRIIQENQSLFAGFRISLIDNS